MFDVNHLSEIMKILNQEENDKDMESVTSDFNKNKFYEDLKEDA